MNSVNNDLSKIDRVSPFRYLRIKACLPAPRSFSQASTSFIAFDCQGIHLLRLFTWFENPTRYSPLRLVFLKTPSFKAYWWNLGTLQYALFPHQPLTLNFTKILYLAMSAKLACFDGLDSSLSGSFRWMQHTRNCYKTTSFSFLEDHKKNLTSFYIFAPSYRFLFC